MKFLPYTLLLLLSIFFVNGENQQTTDVEKPSALAKIPSFLSADLPFKKVGIVAAFVVIATGVVALASFIYPLIAIKLCYWFGSCNSGLIAGYLAQNYLSDSPRIQKRSLEYLGPILQTLVNAYEIYGSDELKKNSLKGNY